MGDDEPELSAAALGSKHLRYLEASLKGMVDEVVKLLSDPEFKEKFLNYQEEETGHSALHKAASAGKLEVAKVRFGISVVAHVRCLCPTTGPVAAV
jgi:hypothetical protein